MKYAISAKGNTIDSKCDPHFARSPYFAIYHSEHNTTTFIENPFRNIPERAGPSVVQLLSSHNIQTVVSIELGEKIQNHFNSKKIGMVILVDENKSIEEIINIINTNNSK
jgi:predicted Fe-Mo cluster-binding NifX family protein